MQSLPEPLLPITTSRPPHLDLFENHEIVVNIPDLRWVNFDVVPVDWRNTTGWENTRDQVGTKRTYNRKYRRARDKVKDQNNKFAGRRNKRPARQQAQSLPPSPPNSHLYIPTGEQTYEDAKFTRLYTGWESGWSGTEWADHSTGRSDCDKGTDLDKIEEPAGWFGDGWSDAHEADKAAGWGTPPHEGEQPWGWDTDEKPEEPDPSWSNHDPFPEASDPAFWTGLSRLWLTDYAMHELSCQIAIERGEATTRAPFKLPWLRVAEYAEDAWAYGAPGVGSLPEIYPVDWNQEQANLDKGEYSLCLDEEKVEELAGRDRLQELTEPEVGLSSWGSEESGWPTEERRWWEIADARRPRLEVSWKNIVGAGGRVR